MAEVLEPKANGATLKLTGDLIEQGIKLHRLMGRYKQEHPVSFNAEVVIQQLGHNYQIGIQGVHDAINAYIHAQDAWMKENVATLVTLMIKNGGDMDAEPVMKMMATMPGGKIESETSFNLLRAEINNLGYNFKKSLEKGVLCN